MYPHVFLWYTLRIINFVYSVVGKKKSDLFIYEYFKFDETYNDKYKCKFSVKIDKKTLQLKDRN